MIVNTLLGYIKKTEDNEHTTVNAQKNIKFSSQRFYGLEKSLYKKYNCARSKNLNVFYHSASMDKQQRMTKNNNKWKT